MGRILITGGTGFIGHNLIKYLADEQLDLISIVRQMKLQSSSENLQNIYVSDLISDPDWMDTLPSIDTVIHLAARAHVLNESASDALEEFRKVNTIGTINIAKQAASKGVRRFIFLSSIGVNGNETKEPRVFTIDDTPAPIEDYAISKYEAEMALKEISAETGMEVVIIRPPLVYGANAPGNFGRLIDIVYRGIPLPLGLISNQRAFISITNLVNFIHICIHSPAAANNTFLVSDDSDVSTTELLRSMAKALGKPSRLIPIPSRILIRLASLLGKQDMARRLCSSLRIDITYTKNTLGWKPVESIDVALQDTADAYLKQLGGKKI